MKSRKQREIDALTATLERVVAKLRAHGIEPQILPSPEMERAAILDRLRTAVAALVATNVAELAALQVRDAAGDDVALKASAQETINAAVVEQRSAMTLYLAAFNDAIAYGIPYAEIKAITNALD